MGPEGPLLVRQGDVALHKEQTSVGQHSRDHTGNFTQVWAAARRKTLLLLWWIEVEDDGVDARCKSKARCLGNYARTMDVYGGRLSASGSEPFASLPWTSFYSVRGYHSGKIVFYRVIR
jgi:hypothetical protein